MSKQIERAVEKNIRDADVDIIGELRRRRAVGGREWEGWEGGEGGGG